MNAATTKIVETLEKHKYLTDKELLSIFSLRDIGMCDQDVCRRIRFPNRTGLGTLYFLEANEKKVLHSYISNNWARLKKRVLNGEFSGDDFPRGFRSILRDYLKNMLDNLQIDIDSLQDEIEQNEHLIDGYNDVLEQL